MILFLLVLTVGLSGAIGEIQPSNPNCTHEVKVPAVCLEIEHLDVFDRELHREEFQKSAIIFIKRDGDFVFPPGGSSSNWFKLTSVRVTNLMPTGKEGLVTLTKGGIGHQNVTLHFESQRGEGYHFLVVIRGKDSQFLTKSL